jgi:ABC-type transporter Mla MlaB component
MPTSPAEVMRIRSVRLPVAAVKKVKSAALVVLLAIIDEIADK